jgi:hypothetical protein
MHRIKPFLLGMGAILVFLGVAGVGGDRNGLPVVGVAALLGLVTWMSWGWVQRRRPLRPTGWSPTAAIAYRPPAAQPSGPTFAVPRALARVEARQLSGSAAMGAGIGFCGLALWLFGWVWGGDNGGDMAAAFEMAPILVHPLAGMAILASFRARTRGRRDGVEELYATCPASDGTRTTAHLLTAWVPALAALIFGVAMAAAVSTTTVATYGDIGGRQLGALVGAAFLGLGATSLGVALARWLPWTLVPIAAVIAIGFGAAALATHGTRTTDPRRMLSTFLVDPEIDVRLTAPHWLAHHLWILSLVGVVALLALLRDRRDARTLVAGAAVVAIAVTAAVMATRPIDAADARRIAALVTDPDALPCRDVQGFAVCTFEGDDALAAAFVEEIRPIAAATAPGALTGWSIQPALSSSWKNLDPQVQELAGSAPDHDRVLPIEYSGHSYALEAVRLWVGLAATGAVDDPTTRLTESIRGQARGVVALWLATRGAAEGVQLDLTSNAVIESSHDGNRPWPDTCYAGDIPVQWAETDVTAARKLLSLPEADVIAVLHPAWEHFTDRRTTTDELMAAVGLDPVGVDGQTSGGSAC